MSFTTPLIPSVPSNKDIKLNSFSSIFKIFVIFGRYSFKKLFLVISFVKTLRFFSFPNSIWISIIYFFIDIIKINNFYLLCIISIILLLQLFNICKINFELGTSYFFSIKLLFILILL